MSRVLHAFVLVSCIAAGSSAADTSWTRFRGPNGTGISPATTVPQSWTEADYNWQVELPGTGHGSPVVLGNRIFLTCGDRETARRSILCLNTADGSVVWRHDEKSQTYRQHRDNGYATATPAVDDRGVVVTWTTPESVVLLALDLDGREMWRRDLGPFIGPHGSGSSPIIVDDLVVLADEQEDMALLARILGRPNPDGPAGKSLLVAVDRRTGKTRWQVSRRTALAAYSTPCVRRLDDGRTELIFTSTAHGITAVDAASGKVTWQLEDVFRDRCVGSPVLAPGLVIAGYGHGTRGTLCVGVRPGDPSKNVVPEIAYRITRSVPLVPTPMVHGDRLLLWADDGVVTWASVADGKPIWQQRVGGAFYGSPVWVDHRLYCIDKRGEMVVLAASDEFKQLARIPLGEPSFATPAVADGVMYLRTRSRLFSLGGKR